MAACCKKGISEDMYQKALAGIFALSESLGGGFAIFCSTAGLHKQNAAGQYFHYSKKGE